MSNNILCPHCDKEIALDKIQELSISKALEEHKAEIEKENNIKMKELENKQQEKFNLERENMKNELAKQLEEDNKEKLSKKSEEIELLQLKNTKLKHDMENDLKRKELEIAQSYNTKYALLEHEYLEKARQDKKKMEKLMESMVNSNSGQILGEAGENYVVDELSNFFKEDTFIEINKGENGGDWIQNVNDDNGNVVGQIYIESKNTKSYSTSWVPKFQKDMEEREIPIGVLISKNFPKEHQGMNSFEDRGIPVYKLDANVFLSHISLIREHIKKSFIQVQIGQLQTSDIPDKLFEYLHSDMYKNAVQQLVVNFCRHKDRVEKRKKMFQKIINEDNQLLNDGVIQISKIFKDDINKIANDDVVLLPELEELKKEI